MAEVIEANGESFYSDEALAKQERLRNMPIGEATWDDFVGIHEPRYPPEDHERCIHCGMDARKGYEFVGAHRYCYLCFGRERHLP